MDIGEFILRAIERVGFPIFISLFLAWLLWKLYIRYETVTSKHADAIAAHARDVKQISQDSHAAMTRNTDELSRNTGDMRDLSDTIKKQLGSDPTGICKFAKVLEDGGFKCTAAELGILFKQYLKDQEKAKARDRIERTEHDGETKNDGR